MTNSINWTTWSTYPANTYHATLWFETFMLLNIPKQHELNHIWTYPIKSANTQYNDNNLNIELYNVFISEIRLLTNTQPTNIGRLKLAIYPHNNYQIQSAVDIAISSFEVKL